MQKKYFISGIGTDVGKSVAAAIVTEALQADYWKPIQCGVEDGGDKNVVKNLISNSVSVFHSESYVLKAPMSPNIAADREGVEILLSNIKLPQTNNTLVIEGAGGLMVPITANLFIADLIKHLDAEVIVVIGNYLGNINHSVLTFIALKQLGLNVKGIVFNGDVTREVVDTIMTHAPWPKLFSVEKHEAISKEVVASYSNNVRKTLSN